MIVKDDIICTECACFRRVFNNDRIVGVCTVNGTNIMKDSNIKGCCLYESYGKKYTEQPEQVEYDAVNHPSHYTQGGIECIDALKAATTGLYGIEAVCTANAIKYLWRWKHKNGIQDIDKAIWYLERLKKELSNDEE